MCKLLSRPFISNISELNTKIDITLLYEQNREAEVLCHPHEQGARRRGVMTATTLTPSIFPPMNVAIIGDISYLGKVELSNTDAVGIAVANAVAAAVRVGDTEVKNRERLFTVLEILKIALKCYFHQKYGPTKGCTLSGHPLPPTLKVSFRSDASKYAFWSRTGFWV